MTLDICKMEQDSGEPVIMEEILQVEDYHKAAEQLSDRLKLFEADRDKLIEECWKAHAHIAKLELVNQVITDQLLENRETQEKLLCIVADELQVVKEELLQVNSELTAAEESKFASLKKTELIELAIGMEKEKNKELMTRISELNETILTSSLAAIEAEKARSTLFSEIDLELQIAGEAVIQSSQQLEEMKSKLKIYKELESDILNKTRQIDSSQLELNHVNQLHISSAQAVLNASNDLNQMKSEMEIIQSATAEKLSYIMALEAGVKQKEQELQSEREKVHCLNRQLEMIKGEMEYLKHDSSNNMERELEFKMKLNTYKELESGLLDKTQQIDSLQLELNQVNQLHISFVQVALKASTDMNQLRSELELIERATTEKLKYIVSWEAGVKQKEQELESERKMVHGLNRQLEMIKGETENLKDDPSNNMERELEFKWKLNEYTELETRLLDKTQLIDSLQLELNKVNRLHISSAQFALNVSNDLKQLRSELELLERATTKKLGYIVTLEAEVKQKEQDLQSEKEKVYDLNRQAEMIKDENENLKDDLSNSMGRELELQVEITSLKSELRRGRSRIATAEAARIRAIRSKSGLYLAVQQLAVEAVAAKIETPRLNQEEKNSVANKTTEDKHVDDDDDVVYSSLSTSTENKSLTQKPIISDAPTKDEAQILESGSTYEVNILKEKLEAAYAEISELEYRLEQAVRKPELAEKAKIGIEVQRRKWIEKQQQRRDSSKMRGQQSAKKHIYTTLYENSLALQALPCCGGSTPVYSSHVPLAKFLSMKI